MLVTKMCKRKNWLYNYVHAFIPFINNYASFKRIGKSSVILLIIINKFHKI